MLTRIKAGQFSVRGVSVGGVYTALHVPELDAAFDIGLAPRSFASARNLFLSHGHVDHTGALITLLGIRGLMRMPKLRVFMPEEIVEPMVAMLEQCTAMQRYDMSIDAVPMSPGKQVSLHGNLSVRAFKTYHPVPSLGYMFTRTVEKLRPEFRKLPGPEIAARRKAGDDLFDTVERRELAYATDTLANVLEHEPDLFDCHVLILECTFLDEKKTLEGARAGCHVHLDELIEVADSFKNDALVLMHFSQLYSPKDVLRILKERCPPTLYDRVVPFVPSGKSWPG